MIFYGAGECTAKCVALVEVIKGRLASNEVIILIGLHILVVASVKYTLNYFLHLEHPSSVEYPKGFAIDRHMGTQRRENGQVGGGKK